MSDRGTTYSASSVTQLLMCRDDAAGVQAGSVLPAGVLAGLVALGEALPATLGQRATRLLAWLLIIAGVGALGAGPGEGLCRPVHDSWRRLGGKGQVRVPAIRCIKPQGRFGGRVRRGFLLSGVLEAGAALVAQGQAGLLLSGASSLRGALGAGPGEGSAVRRVRGWGGALCC